jgi:hypothetical protein
MHDDIPSITRRRCTPTLSFHPINTQRRKRHYIHRRCITSCWLRGQSACPYLLYILYTPLSLWSSCADKTHLSIVVFVPARTCVNLFVEYVSAFLKRSDRRFHQLGMIARALESHVAPTTAGYSSNGDMVKILIPSDYRFSHQGLTTSECPALSP